MSVINPILTSGETIISADLEIPAVIQVTTGGPRGPVGLTGPGAIPPVATIAAGSTITPALPSPAVNGAYEIGAFTGNATIANPTGSPIDAQGIQFRMSNAASGVVLSWGTAYQFGTDVTQALIPTSNGANWVMVFQYRALTSKWRAMSIIRF